MIQILLDYGVLGFWGHPDFYDLRVLPIDGGEVGLSLKDKAERQSTFLFFRASAF